MAADKAYYLNQLYPLQDRVLRVITACDTDFYLTGGTALSRVYLHHRFSDDLDLFVNYASIKDTDPRFRLYCDEVLNALVSTADWQVRVTIRQPFFMRAFVECDRTTQTKSQPFEIGTKRATWPTFGQS
jgi:predicted nucleotidyltransferase component of viral defense system